MSEATPQITKSEKTNKPKDPRRVEAGKRLAAISRAAKERKAKERYETEHETDNTQTNWTLPVVGIVIVGLGGLYFAYNKKTRVAQGGVVSTPSLEKNSETSSTKAQEVKVAPRLDSFDE